MNLSLSETRFSIKALGACPLRKPLIDTFLAILLNAFFTASAHSLPSILTVKSPTDFSLSVQFDILLTPFRFFIACILYQRYNISAMFLLYYGRF